MVRKSSTQSESKQNAIYLSKAHHKAEATIYQSAEKAFQIRLAKSFLQ